MVGFSFKDVNKVLVPFYRNHVSYACLLALFIPYVWYMTGWYRKGTLQRNFWWFLLLLFIVGIQFSYTRAAYVALFMALGAYFVIQWKLIRPALVVMSIGLVVLIASLVQKNKYLDYAPEFDKVITQQNFDKLVEATYKMEDISTMERLYRWVAGAHMTRSHPLVGFGPGNFYNFYKSYTISNFKTYVSDNPERSSVHCYYLLLIIEQGYPGLLLFLLLLFGAMIYGERIYHSTNNYMDKRLVMASCLSIIVVATLILINDMIETDKVGSFFFMAIATIVNVDLKNQRKPSR
jgi:O-antigen ligase